MTRVPAFLPLLQPEHPPEKSLHSPHFLAKRSAPPHPPVHPTPHCLRTTPQNNSSSAKLGTLGVDDIADCRHPINARPAGMQDTQKPTLHTLRLSFHHG